MSAHESHADLEAARQIDQSDHEQRAFERSDAAKVAAVAAVYERWIERSLGPNGDEFIALVNSGRCDVLADLRQALADPDAALSRVRAEARAEAQAEIDRLHAERIAFTARLGFGDDHDSPAASLEEMIDPIGKAFADAGEFYEVPRICEGCGEWLASATCEQCHGAGCLPNPQLAYLECDTCAGVGRVHIGCVQESYADLVTQRDEARAEALREVSCSVCDEVILPDVEACPDGDRWAHRDCMEAGE